jgi:hypothetical protein
LRGPSGRPDERGRTGPETAAVFREPILTELSESGEEGTTHEKERSVSTETKPLDHAGLPRKAVQRYWEEGHRRNDNNDRSAA